MDIPFLLPGTTEPAITIVRPMFTNPRVLVDGVPIKARRGSRFDIPRADGTTTELRITGQLTGLKAVVDGQTMPIEAPIGIPMTVLTLLPIAAVVVGGVIGGLIGGIALVINIGLSRRALPIAAKVASIVGVSVVAVALTVVVALALASAIAPIATFETGTCVNGVREGLQVTASSSRAVDCAAEHDNEVIGVADYPEDGAYPGAAALLDWSATPCLSAFETYVGVAFDASSLDMIAITPSDATWGRGDRTVACIVLTADGTRLTGSVKGSGR